VISYKHWDVEVELHGHHSRGGLFYEWNGAGTSKSNAKVILDFDLNILQQQLLKYFQ
jgi:inosine-uridine nucleoside N-ribohydrolase